MEDTVVRQDAVWVCSMIPDTFCQACMRNRRYSIIFDTGSEVENKSGSCVLWVFFADGCQIFVVKYAQEETDIL